MNSCAASTTRTRRSKAGAGMPRSAPSGSRDLCINRQRSGCLRRQCPTRMGATPWPGVATCGGNHGPLPHTLGGHRPSVADMWGRSRGRIGRAPRPGGAAGRKWSAPQPSAIRHQSTSGPLFKLSGPLIRPPEKTAWTPSSTDARMPCVGCGGRDRRRRRKRRGHPQHQSCFVVSARLSRHRRSCPSLGRNTNWARLLFGPEHNGTGRDVSGLSPHLHSIPCRPRSHTRPPPTLCAGVRGLACKISFFWFTCRASAHESLTPLTHSRWTRFSTRSTSMSVGSGRRFSDTLAGDGEHRVVSARTESGRV